MTIEHESAPVDNEYTDINAFLVDVEKKAYRIALLSIRQHADAIDVLQDSMTKLVEKYAEKPKNQWKPLFYRILNNKITDWHRKQKLNSMLYFWKVDKEDEIDLGLADDSRPLLKPEDELIKQQQQDTMLAQLQQLSEKQRQCFLLRSWEGLSVAQTAHAMECSEGSVKTHYFRAVTKLREALGECHNVTI